jgi:hypothetical protein
LLISLASLPSELGGMEWNRHLLARQVGPLAQKAAFLDAVTEPLLPLTHDTLTADP